MLGLWVQRDLSLEHKSPKLALTHSCKGAPDAEPIANFGDQ